MEVDCWRRRSCGDAPITSALAQLARRPSFEGEHAAVSFSADGCARAARRGARARSALGRVCVVVTRRPPGASAGPDATLYGTPRSLDDRAGLEAPLAALADACAAALDAYADARGAGEANDVSWA